MSRSRALNSDNGHTESKDEPTSHGRVAATISFVLNPYVRERFTKCPSCNAPTRIRKLPLVVHVEHPGGPRLVLLNKTCRLCLACETLIVGRANWRASSSPLLSAKSSRRTTSCSVRWTGDLAPRSGWSTELPVIREHMADFEQYLKVDVVPAYRERSSRTAG